MKNICKRIATLLLAACMLLTVLPPAGDSSQVSAAGLPSSNLNLEPEVVAKNAITDTFFTFAGGSNVNGVDYLYLCLRGGVFAVYNVETQTVIDIEELPTSLPRGVYVDENGIVWVCGSAGLFRYDPVAEEGTDIPLPKDFADDIKDINGNAVNSKQINISVTYGVTGDKNGNIYFGVGHTPCLGVYNTYTQQYSRISEVLDPNVKHVGYAGISYRDGYLYLGIDGDNTHEIIEYNIKEEEIARRIDVSDQKAFTSSSPSKYIYDLNLVGDVLFASFGGASNSFYVDISGEELDFKTFKNNLTIQHAREVSEEVGGKVYFYGRYGTNGKYGALGYIAYDPNTETCTQLTQSNTTRPVLRLSGGNLVTLPDSTLPGKSIISLVNDEENDCIDVYYYNLETEREGYLTSGSIKAAYSLRAPTLDPTGKYIYIGAGSNSKIAKYSVDDGTVVETFYSFDYQTDSLLYHDGYLYAGNYSAATITKIDPDTYKTTPLFSLRYSVFNQCRMWCTTFGENKVFAGTTPYSGYGGMLVWYNFDEGRTYVAAGPNDTDVYYADNTILDSDAKSTDASYTWYNAKTNTKATFSSSTTFTGPIENQVITNLIYKEGLLYGTTTNHGSSGKGAGSENAVLFVYDVTNMELVKTYDLQAALGFDKNIPIEFIDQLAEDPDNPGLFWGVVSGTLFTMTFDVNTETFTVTERFSLKKNEYSAPGMVYANRDIIFDGDYMYVALTKKLGLYMFDKASLLDKNSETEYRKLSAKSPNQMVLADDGNLYWTTNEHFNNDKTAANHLYKFSIADLNDNSTTNIATVVTANGNISYCTTEEELAAALAVAGNTVTLAQNVTLSDVTMAAGAVLDLNGCTLSGTVNTLLGGTVKDSSDGNGKITEKPKNTAAGQVALKDDDGYYRVVGYTVDLEPSANVTGEHVHFWYRVAFTNEDAYAWVETSDFKLGITVDVDGSMSADAEFQTSFINGWAEAMQADNETNRLYLHICILKSAYHSVKLTPTVNGVAHSGSIWHTAVEYSSFTLTFPGSDTELTGNVTVSTHTFG